MYEEELRVAKMAAKRASLVLLEGVSLEDKGEERKGRIDPVTKFDRLSEEIVTDIIRKNYPDDAIMAEEGTTAAGKTGRRWIIDPLDGTTNYSHGYTPWCISIALEEKGKSIVGVVYAPCTGEMFHATKHGGAWLNGKPINVSKRHRLLDSLVATGFPYANEKARKTNLENLSRVLGSCMGIRRDGSAAMDLCQVACGRLDAFWELGLKPWDTAAGELILREAGGKVTDIRGTLFDPHKGNVVATN
ncbi:MAG: inositol monophosphatase, partial [Thermoplasmata archaeon]|nr:inositol monophosphatase [Thermoplasmata archaeon]